MLLNTNQHYKVKEWFPNLINENFVYNNGDLAIEVLMIDSKYITSLIDRLIRFYEELCKKGFHEKTEHSEWNYDGYFRKIVMAEIEAIINPLGLPPTV